MDRSFVVAVMVGLPAMGHAQLLTLSIAPSPATISVGQSSSATVSVSNLATPGGIAGYEATVTFDPSVLSYQGVTFGSLLNAGDVSNSSTSVTVLTGNLVVIEVSGLVTLPVQPSSFSLFDISFQGVANGSSPLSLSNVTFSDTAGGDFSPASLVGGSITVVPEPASLAFASAVVLAIGAGGRRLLRR